MIFGPDLPPTLFGVATVVNRPNNTALCTSACSQNTTFMNNSLEVEGGKKVSSSRLFLFLLSFFLSRSLSLSFSLYSHSLSSPLLSSPPSLFRLPFFISPSTAFVCLLSFTQGYEWSFPDPLPSLVVPVYINVTVWGRFHCNETGDGKRTGV